MHGTGSKVGTCCRYALWRFILDRSYIVGIFRWRRKVTRSQCFFRRQRCSIALLIDTGPPVFTLQRFGSVVIRLFIVAMMMLTALSCHGTQGRCCNEWNRHDIGRHYRVEWVHVRLIRRNRNVKILAIFYGTAVSWDVVQIRQWTRKECRMCRTWWSDRSKLILKAKFKFSISNFFNVPQIFFSIVGKFGTVRKAREKVCRYKMFPDFTVSLPISFLVWQWNHNEFWRRRHRRRNATEHYHRYNRRVNKNLA